MLLKNAASLLQPGGIFFGIMPDSSSLFTRANQQKIGESGVIKLSSGELELILPKGLSASTTFESFFQPAPLKLRVRGETRASHLYIVHCPTLLQLCAQEGLVMIEIQNLADFYEENRRIHQRTLKKILGSHQIHSRHTQQLSLFTFFAFRKGPVTTAPLRAAPPPLT